MDFENSFQKYVISFLENTNGNIRMLKKAEIENDLLERDLYTNSKDVLKWILITIEEKISKK